MLKKINDFKIISHYILVNNVWCSYLSQTNNGPPFVNNISIYMCDTFKLNMGLYQNVKSYWFKYEIHIV